MLRIHLPYVRRDRGLFPARLGLRHPAASSLSQPWASAACASSQRRARTRRRARHLRLPPNPASRPRARRFSRRPGPAVHCGGSGRPPRPRNKSHSGEPRGGGLGPRARSAKVYLCGKGPGLRWGDAPSPLSRRQPRDSSVRGRDRRRTPRRSRSPGPTPQPTPLPEGGGASGRRGETRGAGGGSSRGRGRGRGRARSRAFPARSPASCVLWSRPPPQPCWIVRPPPPPPR